MTAEPACNVGSRADAGIPRPTVVAAGAVCALYVAVLYFRPLMRFFVPTEVIESTNTVLLLTLGALLLWPWRGLTRISGPELGLALCALGVVSVSALVGDADTDSYFRMVRILTGCWLTYVAARILTIQRSGAQAVLLVLSVCGIVNAAVGLWGAVTGRALFDARWEDVGVGALGFDAASGRAGGIAGENYVGFYDAPALLMGLRLLTGRSRVLGLLMVAATGAAIAASLSRTSALTGVVAIGVFVLTRARASRLKNAVMAALALFGVAVMASTMLESQLSRVRSDTLSIVEGRWSAEGFARDSRLYQWATYWEEVLDDPFLGKGPGYLETKLKTGALLPHNSFLDVLVEYGIAGLLVYLAALVLPVHSLLGGLRGGVRNNDYVLWFLACFLGMGASLITLSNPFIRLLWLVGGALCGALSFTSPAKNAQSKTR